MIKTHYCLPKNEYFRGSRIQILNFSADPYLYLDTMNQSYFDGLESAILASELHFPFLRIYYICYTVLSNIVTIFAGYIIINNSDKMYKRYRNILLHNIIVGELICIGSVRPSTAVCSAAISCWSLCRTC